MPLHTLPQGYGLYLSPYGNGYQWQFDGCPRSECEETEFYQTEAAAMAAAWEDLGEPEGIAVCQIDEPGEYLGRWELRILDPDDPDGAGWPSDDSYATQAEAICAAWCCNDTTDSAAL